MGYRHILYIDDDEDDHEIFGLALERAVHGTEYTPMTSARDAFTLLQQRKLMPDLVFLDLNMPLMDGRQFLRELKRSDGLAGIPVIVWTTASYTAAREEMIAMGAFDFLTKPANFGDMVQLLITLLKP